MTILRVAIGFALDTYGEIRLAVPPGTDLVTVPASEEWADDVDGFVKNARVPGQRPAAFPLSLPERFNGYAWASALPPLPSSSEEDKAAAPQPQPNILVLTVFMNDDEFIERFAGLPGDGGFTSLAHVYAVGRLARDYVLFRLGALDAAAAHAPRRSPERERYREALLDVNAHLLRSVPPHAGPQRVDHWLPQAMHQAQKGIAVLQGTTSEVMRCSTQCSSHSRWGCCWVYDGDGKDARDVCMTTSATRKRAGPWMRTGSRCTRRSTATPRRRPRWTARGRCCARWAAEAAAAKSQSGTTRPGAPTDTGDEKEG
jgi:hypothetical protein